MQNVPPVAIAYMAWALGEGGIKYGPYNFRDDKVEAMTYIGAAMRHIADFVDGIDIDPDSTLKKPSLAGAMASLAILADAYENDYLIDNRPKPGAVKGVFDRYVEALKEMKENNV